MFSLGPAGHSHNRTVHHALFPLMTRITRLEFTAESGPGSRMQWNHRGSGHVQVTVDGPDVFFQGAFTLDNGLPCQDRKCWRFGEEGIIFRHFREQRFQDILLLIPDASGIHLVAQAPYSCPPDRYGGRLSLHDDTVELRLRITGARKDEDIRYRYRANPG